MKRTLGIFAVVFALCGLAGTAQAALTVDYTRSFAGLDPDGYFVPGTTQIDVTINATSTIGGADTDPTHSVNKLTTLAFEETLPAGWTYDSILAGPSNPTLPPVANTGTIGFSWITPPATPFSFTYRITVPGNETGPKTLTGLARYRTNGGEIQATTTDKVFQQKPTTVSLARAVSGPGLTGATNQYYVPGNSFTVTITLTKDGAANVTALAVEDTIPAGWTYTGLVAGDADNPTIPPASNTGTIGFAWISAPAFPFDFSYTISVPANETANDRTLSAVCKYRLGGGEILSNTDVISLDGAPCTNLTLDGQGGNFYVPNATKTINVNVSETCTSNITALAVYQTLPAGWTYTGLVAGDADNPTIAPVGNTGTIQFAWISAPAAPFTFSYNVSVPANELGDKDLTGYIEYRLGGGALTSDVFTLTLSGADVTAPVITLTGNATETVECHTSYTDAGATAQDERDGDITANIAVGGDVVDPNTNGTYVITYDVSDAAGNPAVQVTRTVTVSDTTNPVVVLNGSATVTVECGGIYTEEGATASDTCDTSLSTADASGLVDTTVPGDYVISYDATDGSGNAATTVTRTVTVADTTAPVISLQGAASVNVECHSAYNDQGAVAIDTCEGDISGSIVVVNNVDVNTPGSYDVTYDVSDGAGNAATQVTRTVNVTDTTNPVVTIVGASTVTVECGTGFVDAGADANDSCDGTLGTTSDANSTVNSAQPGDYVVTYSASDASGNTGTAQRLVQVRDTTNPIITLNGSASVTIQCGSAYADAGASANDTCDSSVSVSEDSANSVNSFSAGSYTVTLTATDDSGNVATTTRSVTVEDTTAPVITLTGSAALTVECGSSYTDAGATATDTCEGNVTNSILAGGAVNTATPGQYVLTFDVSDSSGNAATQVTRTVTVADTTNPVVTLNGAATVNVECGGSYTEDGATATDACEGDITASIVTGGDTVNASATGTYVVTYTVADAAGNTGTASRTVNVTDTTAPVITVNGGAATVECGGSYSDAGATVVDTCDSAVTVTGDTSAVNTASAGTYTVTYTSTDASGNVGSATRTVNVTDTTVPVVTLTGAATVTVECHGIYTEQGATATDTCDGNVAVTIGGQTVDTNAPGDYTVVYTATDSSGNTGSTARTVTVSTCDTCTDSDQNGLADNIFTCLDTDGESLLLNVDGGTCTRRVYAVTWFGDVEGSDISATVANPNDENQVVTVGVNRSVIGAGQQAILVISIACSLEDLLGDQAFNLGTTPDGVVAGNAWFDVSIVVTSDGGASYAKLDNSILVTNPISVSINGLSATPGSSVGLQSYSTYIAQDPNVGAEILATDGASWTGNGIDDTYADGTLSGTSTHLSVFGSFETAAPAPVLTVTPNPAYDFIVGIAKTNTEITNTITVKNTGGGSLSGAASITDPNGVFTLVGDATYTLAAGASDTITVRFVPTKLGSFTGSLTLTDSSGSPVTVTLKGTGTLFDKKFLILGCSADGGASNGIAGDLAVVALALGGIFLSSRSLRRAKQN